MTLVGAAAVTVLTVPVAQAFFVPASPSCFCPALLLSAEGRVLLRVSRNGGSMLNSSSKSSLRLASPTKRQRDGTAERRRGFFPMYSIDPHAHLPPLDDFPPLLSVTRTISAAARRPGLLFGSSNGVDPETEPPAVHDDDEDEDGKDGDANVSGDTSVRGRGRREEVDEEEERMFKVEPVIDLPVDGVLLQLFPAVLIGVLGIVLTILVQSEAARFDSIGVGGGKEGGNGVVVVKDLRERATQ